jgi:hypothetical protein
VAGQGGKLSKAAKLGKDLKMNSLAVVASIVAGLALQGAWIVVQQSLRVAASSA